MSGSQEGRDEPPALVLPITSGDPVTGMGCTLWIGPPDASLLDTGLCAPPSALRTSLRYCRTGLRLPRQERVFRSRRRAGLRRGMVKPMAMANQRRANGETEALSLWNVAQSRSTCERRTRVGVRGGAERTRTACQARSPMQTSLLHQVQGQHANFDPLAGGGTSLASQH